MLIQTLKSVMIMRMKNEELTGALSRRRPRPRMDVNAAFEAIQTNLFFSKIRTEQPQGGPIHELEALRPVEYARRELSPTKRDRECLTCLTNPIM